jgi:arsenate reductase
MKVLVLCTGNSCRSIIAEAILNANGIEAYSSGVAPSGKVNPNAKRVLEENGIWKDCYYSKSLDKVMDIDFDLVVTVCDNAKESCPTFPKKIETIHIPFEDPDGKEYEEFVKTYKKIEDKLLKVVKEKMEKRGEKEWDI